MPVDPIAEKILKQSQITGSFNTFILGSTDKRVTFNTQQTRAFNLVWALFQEKIIKMESEVAVVGGGLAGMTAAAALNLKGCKVTLYHDKETLMNIQEGCIHRYIHPNIYDWPLAGCELQHTDFPCMNWSAANANNVFEQIQERWATIKPDIEVISSTYVEEIKSSGGRPRVYPADNVFDRPFDCVIIATGFGIENVFPNTRSGPYWHADDLGVGTKTRKAKQYLVSGCGDGGLIDTLRIRIKEFNHEEFSKAILENTELDAIKPKLIEIEENAPEDEEDFASYISDEYRKLDLPQSLLDNLKKRLRSDTLVELNGNKSTPMSPKACLINRFSIFLLMKLNAISYKAGKIVSASNNDQQYQIIFNDGGGQIQRDYDESVVRHGPKPIISTILGTGLSLPTVEEKDKITSRSWSADFYPITTEKTNKMSKADEYQVKFRKMIRKIDPAADTMVIDDVHGEQIYVVLSAKHETPELKKIDSFEGIPVRHRPAIDFSFGSSQHGALSGNHMLSLGAKIFNSEMISATLGCFVMLRDQRIAFLTSAHLFQNQNIKRLYHTTKENSKSEIGTLHKKTTLKVSSDSRRLKNVADAAVVLLNSNVPYSKSRMLGGEKRLRVQGMATAKIGDRVFKYGAGSGLSSGEVTGIHSSIIIEKDERKYYFEDAIMVHGNDTAAFASSGDSGAMVFREDGKILGMIFATSRYAAVLCPIEAILKELQCSLLIY